MVAVADPEESWSVARYVEAATAAVEDIFRRGRQPVIVGGTGLYMDDWSVERPLHRAPRGARCAGRCSSALRKRASSL